MGKESPVACSTPTVGSCPPSACQDRAEHTLDLVQRQGKRQSTLTISGFPLSSFSRASCSTFLTTCGKHLSTRRLTRSRLVCEARRWQTTRRRDEIPSRISSTIFGSEHFSFVMQLLCHH